MASNRSSPEPIELSSASSSQTVSSSSSLENLEFPSKTDEINHGKSMRKQTLTTSKSSPEIGCKQDDLAQLPIKIGETFYWDDNDLEHLRLPFKTGWKREIVLRKTNPGQNDKNKLMSDIYYFSPTGKKLRSMVQISTYLESEKISPVNLTHFTFKRERIYKPPYEIVRAARNSNKKLSFFGSPSHPKANQTSPAPKNHKRKSVKSSASDLSADTVLNSPEICVDVADEEWATAEESTSPNPLVVSAPAQLPVRGRGRPRGSRALSRRPTSKDLFIMEQTQSKGHSSEPLISRTETFPPPISQTKAHFKFVRRRGRPRGPDVLSIRLKNQNTHQGLRQKQFKRPSPDWTPEIEGLSPKTKLVENVATGVSHYISDEEDSLENILGTPSKLIASIVRNESQKRALDTNEEDCQNKKMKVNNSSRAATILSTPTLLGGSLNQTLCSRNCRDGSGEPPTDKCVKCGILYHKTCSERSGFIQSKTMCIPCGWSRTDKTIHILPKPSGQQIKSPRSLLGGVPQGMGSVTSSVLVSPTGLNQPAFSQLQPSRTQYFLLSGQPIATIPPPPPLSSCPRFQGSITLIPVQLTSQVQQPPNLQLCNPPLVSYPQPLLLAGPALPTSPQPISLPTQLPTVQPQPSQPAFSNLVARTDTISSLLSKQVTSMSRFCDSFPPTEAPAVADSSVSETPVVVLSDDEEMDDDDDLVPARTLVNDHLDQEIGTVSSGDSQTFWQTGDELSPDGSDVVVLSDDEDTNEDDVEVVSAGSHDRDVTDAQLNKITRRLSSASDDIDNCLPVVFDQTTLKDNKPSKNYDTILKPFSKDHNTNPNGKPAAVNTSQNRPSLSLSPTVSNIDPSKFQKSTEMNAHSTNTETSKGSSLLPVPQSLFLPSNHSAATDLINKSTELVSHSEDSTTSQGECSKNGSLLSANKLLLKPECLGQQVSKLTRKNFLGSFRLVQTNFTIMMKIFANLPVSDLLRASCVCKLWRQLGMQPCLWRSVHLDNVIIHKWKEATQFFNKVGVRCLNLEGFIVKTSESKMWEDIKQYIPSLTHLEELFFDKVPGTVVDSITQRMPHLVNIGAKSVMNTCILSNTPTIPVSKKIEKMNLAVEAVTSGSMAVSGASRLFKVSETDLIHLTQTTDKLTAEEESAVLLWCMRMNRMGFFIQRDTFIKKCQEMFASRFSTDSPILISDLCCKELYDRNMHFFTSEVDIKRCNTIYGKFSVHYSALRKLYSSLGPKASLTASQVLSFEVKPLKLGKIQSLNNLQSVSVTLLSFSSACSRVLPVMAVWPRLIDTQHPDIINFMSKRGIPTYLQVFQYFQKILYLVKERPLVILCNGNASLLSEKLISKCVTDSVFLYCVSPDIAKYVFPGFHGGLMYKLKTLAPDHDLSWKDIASKLVNLLSLNKNSIGHSAKLAFAVTGAFPLNARAPMNFQAAELKASLESEFVGEDIDLMVLEKPEGSDNSLLRETEVSNKAVKRQLSNKIKNKLLKCDETKQQQTDAGYRENEEGNFNKDQSSLPVPHSETIRTYVSPVNSANSVNGLSAESDVKVNLVNNLRSAETNKNQEIFHKKSISLAAQQVEELVDPKPVEQRNTTKDSKALSATVSEINDNSSIFNKKLVIKYKDSKTKLLIFGESSSQADRPSTPISGTVSGHVDGDKEITVSGKSCLLSTGIINKAAEKDDFKPTVDTVKDCELDLNVGGLSDKDSGLLINKNVSDVSDKANSNLDMGEKDMKVKSHSLDNAEENMVIDKKVKTSVSQVKEKKKLKRKEHHLLVSPEKTNFTSEESTRGKLTPDAARPDTKSKQQMRSINYLIDHAYIKFDGGDKGVNRDSKNEDKYHMRDSKNEEKYHTETPLLQFSENCDVPGNQILEVLEVKEGFLAGPEEVVLVTGNEEVVEEVVSDQQGDLTLDVNTYNSNSSMTSSSNSSGLETAHNEDTSEDDDIGDVCSSGSRDSNLEDDLGSSDSSDGVQASEEEEEDDESKCQICMRSVPPHSKDDIINWIDCDRNCGRWFHVICVTRSQTKIDAKNFVCPSCRCIR